MQTSTNLKDCISTSEKSLETLLNALTDEFKRHLEQFKSTIEAQKLIIESLWVISQRFLILTRGAICVRPYPREQSDREERVIRDDFTLKKAELRYSNSKLTASLESLKQKCRIFDRTLENVDMTVPSHIVGGTIKCQPIQFYIEFYADFLKFLEEIQGKMSLLEIGLNVEDIKLIVEYKTVLQPNETFMDYFDNSFPSD